MPVSTSCTHHLAALAGTAILLVVTVPAAMANSGADGYQNYGGDGGGGGSAGAIIQNLFNTFSNGMDSSRREREQMEQNQQMQRFEEERRRQEILERQYDHDFEILKHAQSVSECELVITPRAKENCIGHFTIVLPAQRAQAEKEEAERQAVLKAAREKLADEGSNDLLEGMEPVSSPKRAASPAKVAPMPTSASKPTSTGKKPRPDGTGHKAGPIPGCLDPKTKRTYVVYKGKKVQTLETKNFHWYNFENTNSDSHFNASACWCEHGNRRGQVGRRTGVGCWSLLRILL